MKDNNFIKKLILAAAAFIAQILIVMIIIFIFPDFLVGLFSSKSDVDIIYMGKIALLLSAPSYLFKWFTMTVGSYLTGLE